MWPKPFIFGLLGEINIKNTSLYLIVFGFIYLFSYLYRLFLLEEIIRDWILTIENWYYYRCMNNFKYYI